MIEKIEGAYCFLENKPFMPLSIERLSNIKMQDKIIECYAISHVFTQHGDLMRDPEMCFGVFELNGEKLISPYAYKQDRLSYYEKSVFFDLERIDDKKQREETEFAQIWLSNIENLRFFRN